MIRRGKASTWKRTAGVVMALGLLAGACSSSSDDDSSSDTSGSETEATDAPDSTEGETETTDAPDSTEGETTDTVEVVQDEGGRLAAVQDAGVLVCGVNDTLPGFGIVDDAGEYSGFDVDFCRV
ncbi:MAG: hypothetical protein IZT58_16060, partial [Actinobacteria bacterium]|nr:hypothetical protein [Actinomycetota bacterium]